MSTLEVDPEEARWVVYAYELLLDKRWSLGAIAQHFNDMNVGGIAWDTGPVRKLLSCETHIGVLADGKTHREYNPETLRFEVKRRPRSEWRIRRARHLQLVTHRRWKAAQRRLAEIKAAYPGNSTGCKPRRLDVHKTRLVRPICGCCGQPMYLGRSGKYAAFTCFNGRSGKHGCTYRSYKAASIVENCMLNHVLSQVLTEENFARLVEQANNRLSAEAAKPLPDLDPLKQELKAAQRLLNRWRKLSEADEDGDVKTIVSELRKSEQKVNELKRKIQQAEKIAAPLRLIESSEVPVYLLRLRELLQDDVAVAAEFLERITGPVVIHMEPGPAKRGRRWTAHFTVNLVPAVAELARTSKYPTACSWDLLLALSWTFEVPCVVALEKRPQYVELAPQIKEFREKGASIEALAVKFKKAPDYIRSVLRFASTGQGPVWRQARKPRSRQPGGSKISASGYKYKRFAQTVDQLRGDRLPWPTICAKVEQIYGESCSIPTAKKAWQHLHPGAADEAVESGLQMKRGSFRRLPPEKHQQITAMLRERKKPEKNAAVVGCGVMTVYRAQRALRQAELV